MTAPRDVPVRCPYCGELTAMRDIEFHIVRLHTSRPRGLREMGVLLIVAFIVLALLAGLVAATYQMSVLAR